MRDCMDFKSFSLCDLGRGGSAFICEIRSDNPKHVSHLINAGFVPGERVSCRFKSPMGDPIAYAVGDVLVAIREKDARKILVAGDINDTSAL